VIAAIVNPRAASGLALRRWSRAAVRLGPLEVVYTKTPGHATVLARDLAAAGCTLLIVAGGDGTLNEVVNGIVGVPAPPVLGFLPIGTGSDFARSVRLASVPSAIDAILARRARSVDVFRARFRSPEQAAAERCFVNAAGFGLAAEAARTVGGIPRILPAQYRYLAAAVPTLVAGRSFRISLRLDDIPASEFDITTAAVANGRFQGGGIQIAPEAALDDGLADITVVERVSAFEVARRLPILYSGALYTHPRVRHWRAARVRVDSAALVPLELDGEPAGFLPLDVTVLPEALSVFV
jgi:diacylglycerol kinase (ATP)